MNPVLKRLLKSTAVTFADKLGPHRISSANPKLWVLMYHRILPKQDKRFLLEEPGMIVTPETFSMHMREVKRHFDLVSLKEWVKLKEQNAPLPRRACAITFDDGWADNYQYALPIIKEERIPSTVFVVAEKIGTDFQFWPNIILTLLMDSPAGLAAMQKHPLFAPLFNQILNTSKIIDRECAAVYISHLKQLTDAEIFAALKDIEWPSLLNSSMPNALMTWQELAEMKASGLVDIGSHTCSHKRLTTALSETELVHEIVESKTLIEQRLASPVELFCFPNGDYCPRALELVKQNYSAAVTTQKAIVTANQCANHELTRIGIHEEVSSNSRLFGGRLSGWI